MRVYNVHERLLPAEPVEVGALLDGLAGPSDRLWPRENWPPMQLDQDLNQGASGGHGPIRYSVTEYVPGNRVVFRFEESGLIGWLDGRHLFEVVPRRAGVLLRHIVDGQCDLKGWLKWQVLVGPLHDALLEDSMDLAETGTRGKPARPARWSLWVRFLRWVLAKKSRQ